MKIDVKGHSGCSVEIKNDEKGLYIQKSTYDKGYLKRLELQAQKQKEAAAKEYQHIRIPKIFYLKADNESTIINMEYVYSKNFIEYFEQAGFEQIKYFVKALCMFIETEMESSEFEDFNLDLFMQKYDSVKKCIANNVNIHCKKVDNIIKKTDELFSKLKVGKIPIGTCHGDLTFSNILFNGNNYYLIDFLDSFIETPLQDIVKIRQDSCHMWSQLMYSKQYDKIRLTIVSQKIDKEINSYFTKYEWYKQYYLPFQVMNLLRVLQYAKEQKVIDYLSVELEGLLK